MSAVASLARVDIRDVFFEEFFELARRDPRVIILCDDQGAMTLTRMRAELPDQYVNVGIAEQNLVDTAAGLALGGMRPFVYGITNFVSLRCCEQISVCASFMNLPIAIIASGGGLTYASDGPTHHATQDIAILRTMPGMTILNPADARSSSAAVKIAYECTGPCYIRIEKGVVPELYSADEEFQDGFSVLRAGMDALIVGTGFLIHEAIRAAELLGEKGIRTGVVDLYRLKPIDSDRLASVLASSSRIVVMEEQTPIGGVGSIVCELIASRGLGIPVRHFSLPDRPLYLYGPREWLQAQTGLDAASVAASVIAWVSAAPLKA